MATKKNKSRGANKSNPNKKSIGLIAAWNFCIEFIRHEVLTLFGKLVWFLILNFTLLVALVISAKEFWANFVTDTASLIAQHPWIATISVLVLVLITPLVRGFIKFLLAQFLKLFAPHDASGNIVATTPDALQSKDLALSAGLTSFSPHLTKKDKRLDWDECRNKIKVAKDLRIMGANGWDTFGSPSSPLHRTLTSFKGDLKILLLSDNPHAEAVRERVQDLNRNADSYVQQIQDSLNFLKNLKTIDSKRQIEVRLYESPLNWKMIICNEYMWLQHYWPDRDIENTPVYAFFSDGGSAPSSLFHPFHGEWKKQWASAKPYAL